MKDERNTSTDNVATTRLAYQQNVTIERSKHGYWLNGKATQVQGRWIPAVMVFAQRISSKKLNTPTSRFSRAYYVHACSDTVYHIFTSRETGRSWVDAVYINQSEVK